MMVTLPLQLPLSLLLFLLTCVYPCSALSSSSSSSSSCPEYPSDPLFRLIHPRNGTLYLDYNPVISTVRIESVEMLPPIEMSLYRHTSPCSDDLSCGYGKSPEITHIATHVHEENNDLWLTHDWGVLQPGVYVMHIYTSTPQQSQSAAAIDSDVNMSSSSSIPNLSHYRQCFIWHTTNTFVVVNNHTIWKTDDQRNQTQLYRFRMLALWAELNGASGLHQFDLFIDPVSNYRTLRAVQDLPSNSSILNVPVHIVFQTARFLHDTPFLRDITSMDHFFHNITDLHELTSQQSTYLSIVFPIWCLAVGEQCYWIHFIRSWPHADFYFNTIENYRKNHTLPKLSFMEYRQHTPLLPLLWTDIEVAQWAATSAYSLVVNIRKEHQAVVKNSAKFITSSVLSNLNLPPPYTDINDTLSHHPFIVQFVTWSVTMRITRGWHAKWLISNDYKWSIETKQEAQMSPVMDIFDHDDILGTPVISNVNIPHVSLYSPINFTITKGDIIYLTYRVSEMTPTIALLHYGWIMPESAYFISISISTLPSHTHTSLNQSDHNRLNSVQIVLKQLNIPSKSSFSIGVGTRSLPPLLMLRIRLLFFEFETCRENPHDAKQLSERLKNINQETDDIILSSASERVAHEFLRDIIYNNVRLPEREQEKDREKQTNNPNNNNNYDIFPVGTATVAFSEWDDGSNDSSNDPISDPISPTPVTIPTYHVPLLADAHYESMLNNTKSTYHEKALSLFTLTERKLSRHFLQLIQQHQIIADSL